MKVTIIYKDHNASTFVCDTIKITAKYINYHVEIMDYSIPLSLVDYVFIDGKMEYCRMGSFVKEGK